MRGISQKQNGNGRGHTNAAWAAAGAGGAVYAVLAVLVRGQQTDPLDVTGVRLVHPLVSTAADVLFKTLTFLMSGAGLGMFAALALLAFFVRSSLRAGAVRVGVAMGGGEAIVDGLKLLSHRTRPTTAGNGLNYSFPSGHAFFAMAVYGLIALLIGRHLAHKNRRGPFAVYTFAFVLIFLTGVSRVYLGFHYASDVVGGWAAGLVWLLICHLSGMSATPTHAKVAEVGTTDIDEH